jgi:hypothetical protein
MSRIDAGQRMWRMISTRQKQNPPKVNRKVSSVKL